MNARVRSGREGISSIDEVREEARKPISGSVLSCKLNTAHFGRYSRMLTSGKVETLRAERGSLGDIGVRGVWGEGGGRWTSMDAAVS